MKIFNLNGKEKHKIASPKQYAEISKMFTEILNGPLAATYKKSDSSEFSYDGYSNSKYEDDILEIYSYSGTGIGMGRIPGVKRIILKDYGCVYDEKKAIDTNLWFDHLVNVYNESMKIKERRYNMHHKMEKLFDYVPSGYKDGIINVEYEKLVTKSFSESEGEDVLMTHYTCKIFLVPLNQYVYVRDEIYHKLDRVTREGKWVDYVSSLIDKFELLNNNQESINENNDLLKQKQKTLINNSPIDDSSIFE